MKQDHMMFQPLMQQVQDQGKAQEENLRCRCPRSQHRLRLRFQFMVLDAAVEVAVEDGEEGLERFGTKSPHLGATLSGTSRARAWERIAGSHRTDFADATAVSMLLAPSPMLVGPSLSCVFGWQSGIVFQISGRISQLRMAQ